MVMLIRRAGGIVLGKTVTTEFASLEPARHAQSAQSRAYAGRIVVGLGRGGGGRHAAAGARQPDRRLGHPSRRLLRRRRLQALLPAAADGRDEMLLLVARHGRAVRRQRGRRRVRRRRDQRPRSAGRWTTAGGAGHRARAHPSWHEASAAMQSARRARRARGRTIGREAQGPGRCRRSSPTPCARTASCRATRRSARSLSNTTAIAIASARSCARSSTRPRRIDADTYDDARRTTRRARRALVDLLADGEVMLTPSAPGAAPTGTRLDRRADLQPALDAAGHALRQRPGALGCRRSAARRADRGAVRPRPVRAVRGCAARARHRAQRMRLTQGNELTRWFVRYYFCIPPPETSCERRNIPARPNNSYESSTSISQIFCLDISSCW